MNDKTEARSPAQDISLRSNKPAEEKKETLEWYFRPWIIFLAILATGPLGLFLLWFRPATKLYVKVLISALVFALTVWMTVETVNYYQIMAQHFRELAEALQS